MPGRGATDAPFVIRRSSTVMLLLVSRLAAAPAVGVNAHVATNQSFSMIVGTIL
jgi:hypothetical protein